MADDSLLINLRLLILSGVFAILLVVKNFLHNLCFWMLGVTVPVLLYLHITEDAPPSTPQAVYGGNFLILAIICLWLILAIGPPWSISPKAKLKILNWSFVGGCIGVVAGFIYFFITSDAIGLLVAVFCGLPLMFLGVAVIYYNSHPHWIQMRSKDQAKWEAQRTA